MHYYAYVSGLLIEPTTPPAFELRVTMLITNLANAQNAGELLATSSQIIHSITELDHTGLHLFIYVEPLPPLPRPPITVDTVVAHRDSPTIKHTRWAQYAQGAAFLK